MVENRPNLRLVVMAKRPVPGAVKTRLSSTGLVDPGRAAQLAGAMLRCFLDRIVDLGEVIVAITGEDAAEAVGPAPWEGLPTMEQGAGSLGERIDRVWARLGSDRPVAFFGGDSPDVPADALAAIAPALDTHDVALGPSTDGGYWTLAASRHRPQLLRNIDWGGDCVYDLTCRHAMAAGLSVHRLPVWLDVDHPDDVHSLRRRLDGYFDPASPDPASGRPSRRGSGRESDLALGRLRERLDELFGPLVPSPVSGGRAEGARG